VTGETEFYKRRDRRTVQLGGRPDRLAVPVTVHVGAAASTKAGQVCLLALIDLLARVHRHLDLQLPAVSLPNGGLLADAATDVARAINPFIVIGPSDGDGPSIGIGSDVPQCTWHVGASGWRATLDRDRADVTGDARSIWGAMLAACLGSAAVYWHVHDRDLTPTCLSLWDLSDGDGPDLTGPLNVRDVAVIGAGAVGAALAYWLRVIGVLGRWVFVDKDLVELHNTNRSMGYTAADAGWPDSAGHPKAQTAAAILGAEHFDGWYHEWMATKPSRPDLIITLANGAGVRHVIGQRSEPILLHASTSREYTAELHRHRPGVDQCITCRFPDPGEPVFECSTAPEPVSDDTEDSSDAALPFLSATAGLMLAAALIQLPDGPLLTGHANHWRVHLEPTTRVVQAAHWNCADSCVSVHPPELRAVINAGRRWADVEHR
jgi:hypothetical protein